MSCKLTLKADNGERSELFKSLAEVVSDPKEAVDLYFYTKTDTFKDSYKGSLDKNSEPIYSEMSKDTLNLEKDFAGIELDSRADVYKKLIDAMPGIHKALSDKIAFMEKTAKSAKSKTYLKSLKAVQESLLGDDIFTSLPKFIQVASTQVSNLKRRAEKIQRSPGENYMDEISAVFKATEAYSMLEGLNAKIFGDQEVRKLFPDDMFSIGKTIAKIGSVRATYIDMSKNYLVDEFHKRDSTWARKDIKSWLDKAPTDIGWTENMLGYMGDSHDKVLSMTATVLAEAEHKIRRASVEFNKDLQEQLEIVEAKHTGKTSEMFADLIYTNDQGEQHILDIEAEFTNGESPKEDAMYKKVQAIKSSNTELYNFLEFFSEKYQALQQVLPPDAQMGTRIPSVLKSEFELMEGKNFKEKTAILEAHMKSKIIASNTDLERGSISGIDGKPVKRIPVFYTQKYDSIRYKELYGANYESLIEKGETVEEAEKAASMYAKAVATKEFSARLTVDLAHSLQAWHTMAINFSAKNELINIFEAAEAVTGSEFRKYTALDAAGRKVIDQDGNEREVSGLEAKAPQFLREVLEVQLYGQKERNLGAINIFGKDVDINKMLRNLKGFNSLVQLSFNLAAGVANIGIGEYNNMLEAVAGEFYSTKSYRKASRFYAKNMLGTVSDVGARTSDNIVNLLEQHYNMLQSFHEDGSIKTTEANKFKRLLSQDALFFINSSGEHFMQTRSGMAILEEMSTFDKDGNDLGKSVLDSHSVVDGKLVVPNVFVKNKNGDLVKFNTSAQNDVSNKIGAINRKAQGNYSQKTANNMQKDARLALLTQFRGFMYEGIVRRFGSKGESKMLQQETEGFYRSGSKFIWKVSKDLAKMRFDLMKEDWGKLSSHEKANVKRMTTEVAVATLLAAASAMLGHAGKNLTEPDKSDTLGRLKYASFLALSYEVNRMFTEVVAYTNPAEAYRLMRSPMASTAILVDTSNLLMQFTKDAYSVGSGGEAERYTTTWRKGQLKLEKKFSKVVPIYKHLSVLNADGWKDKGVYFNN